MSGPRNNNKYSTSKQFRNRKNYIHFYHQPNLKLRGQWRATIENPRNHLKQKNFSVYHHLININSIPVDSAVRLIMARGLVLLLLLLLLQLNVLLHVLRNSGNAAGSRWPQRVPLNVRQIVMRSRGEPVCRCRRRWWRGAGMVQVVVRMVMQYGSGWKGSVGQWQRWSS